MQNVIGAPRYPNDGPAVQCFWRLFRTKQFQVLLPWFRVSDLLLIVKKFFFTDSIPQLQDVRHSERHEIVKQVSDNKKSNENFDDEKNNNKNEDKSPAKLQLKYRLLKEPRVLKLEDTPTQVKNLAVF